MHDASRKRRIGLGLAFLLALAGLLMLMHERQEANDAPADPPAVVRAPEVVPPRGPSDVVTPVLSGLGGTADDWTLAVTVRDEDGEPLQGERVLVRLWTEDLPDYELATNDAGVARLGPFLPPMPPGGLEVHVETKECESVPYYVRATRAQDGSAELRAAVSLTTSPSVSGWVRLPPGVPPEHAYLWIHRKFARNHDYHEIEGERLPLDEAGRFFTKFDSCEYAGDGFGIEVAIAHEGRRWYGCVNGTTPARDVEVPIGPLRPGDPAVLRVHVETPTGEPTEHMLVTRFDDALQVSWGYTAQGLDEDSECAFLWRPGTQVYIQAEVRDPDGYGDAVLGPVSADETDVQIRVAPTRVLRGAVRTQEGLGVPGARVWARVVVPTARGRDVGFFTEATRADDAGRFELRGLGPYTYTVDAQAGGSAGPIRARDVGPEENEVELVVRPPTRVQLRVVDPAGLPVEGARVELSLPPRGVTLDPNAPPLMLAWPLEFQPVGRHDTNPAGRAAFYGDVAGLGHRVVVSPPRSRPELAYVERQGWRPTDDTIRLESGLVIRGRAVKADGKPLADAYVHARPLDEAAQVGTRYRRVDGSEFTHFPTAYLQRDADGRFAIGPLPPGRYALHADGGPEVSATAGDEEVALSGASPFEQVWLVVHLQDLHADDRGVLALLGSRDGRVRALPLGPGGRIVFPHVGVSEKPDLWIGGLAGGRYVWLRALELSEESSELKFSAKRGGAIRGRIEAPAGVTLDAWRVLPLAPLLRRDANGAALGGFPCSYGEDGRTFELSGVPPGSWRVQVEGHQADGTYAGSVEARSGEDVVVKLAPR